MTAFSKPQIESRRTQIFAHEIHRDGLPYEFRLSHRPIEFGPKYIIDYHWIDLRSLRLPKKFRDRRAPQFDNMISFWLSGLLDAPQVSDDDLRDLLLAACFPGFSPGRAMQSVYLDAHLHNERSASMFNSLDDAARTHVKNVIDSRNQWLLRQEMFRLLGGRPLVVEANRTIMTALDGILSDGIQMVRGGELEGLYDFVDRTTVFVDEKRRRRGDTVARHFINQIQYLSKVAYYRVYSEVW